MARKHFSQREGRAPAITVQDFAYRFYNIFESFVADGYFNRLNLGVLYEGSVSKKLKRDLAIAFSHRSHEMTPTENNLLNMNRDSIFDLIEFLSDYVSEPLSARLQRISDSGIPVENALEKWRESVNEFLWQLDPPHNLTANKEIEILPPSAGLRRLVDDHASPSRDTRERVDHACRLFLKRGATVHDRRSALKDLADVLEPMRNDLNAYIGNKEANKLFDIANNYGIRHNNREQMELDENYARWFFYSVLATIDLVASLGNPNNDRQQ